MSELIPKENKRDAIHASRVKRTARFCNVSERLVYKVLEMDRNNDLVITVFMTLAEKERQLEQEMLQLVNELVPFDQERKRATQRKPNRTTAAGNQTIA